jgi:hypothetical protein
VRRFVLAQAKKWIADSEFDVGRWMPSSRAAADIGAAAGCKRLRSVEVGWLVEIPKKRLLFFCHGKDLELACFDEFVRQRLK